MAAAVGLWSTIEGLHLNESDTPEAVAALLERNPHPSEDEIRHAISGNLCRCTGYMNIVKAVQYAADKMAEGA